MGLIANYQEIETNELDEIIESIESEENIDLSTKIDFLSESSTLNQYNMDKMWDSLNFLISGERFEDLTFKNLISDAVFGSCQFPENISDKYLSFVAPDTVCDIADELNEIDIDSYLEQFNMNEFAKNNIYPEIWDCADEEELIKSDLKRCFEGLKDFYIEIAKNGNSILVSIG